jgi:predicted transcriptional regulator
MKNESRIYLPTPKDIKTMRKNAGYTQVQLAELAGLSQSLIARIENDDVNPRLSTLKKIMNVLNVESKGYEDITARDIDKSHIVSISSEKTVSQAIVLMDSKSISQLPVIDSENRSKVIGSISEKDLMLHLTKTGRDGLGVLISTIMGRPFPEAESKISLREIERLLATNPALLIKEEGSISHIITKSDLLRFYKGSE